MSDVIKGFQPCDVIEGFQPFRHPPGMLTYFHYFAAALLTFDSPFLSAAAGMLTSLPYSLFSDPHYTYREGNWPNCCRRLIGYLNYSLVTQVLIRTLALSRQLPQRRAP